MKTKDNLRSEKKSRAGGGGGKAAKLRARGLSVLYTEEPGTSKGYSWSGEERAESGERGTNFAKPMGASRGIERPQHQLSEEKARRVGKPKASGIQTGAKMFE